jgi:hypothetical protein
MGTGQVAIWRPTAENSSRVSSSDAKMLNELFSYAVRKQFPARDEPAFSNRDITDGGQHSPVRALEQFQIVVDLSVVHLSVVHLSVEEQHGFRSPRTGG